MKITPAILCGGSDARHWPLSRKSYPKQFLPFIGSESLFQTCARRWQTENFTAPVIITGDPFRFLALQQLHDNGIPPHSILIEVQTGAYLKEDDIVRHDDIYARV